MIGFFSISFHFTQIFFVNFFYFNFNLFFFPTQFNPSNAVYNSKIAGPVRRAHAAHLNLLEVFPFFAAAVILAKIMNVDPEVVEFYSAIHLVSRVIYVPLYIWIENDLLSSLRSAAWTTALFSASYLIYLAAKLAPAAASGSSSTSN